MAKFTLEDDDRDEAGAESTPPRRDSFTEGEPPRGGSSGRPPGSRPGSGSRLWIWLVLLGVVAFGGAFAVVNYMVMPHAVKHGDELQVPDLTGAPLDSAQVALQGLGLRVTRSGEVPSLTVPAGRIVSTDPPAGSLVKVDRMVSVIISHGPEARSVTSRLSVDALLDQLDAGTITRLFQRSMAVSRRDSVGATAATSVEGPARS